MKQFCKKGHDTNVSGRSKNGTCRKCNYGRPRPSHNRRKLKVTSKVYGEMVKKQNGCCAICRKDNLKLQVDHDHVTGKVRGLLCSECNLALGHYEKMKDLAETYLSPSSATASHLGFEPR